MNRFLKKETWRFGILMGALLVTGCGTTPDVSYESSPLVIRAIDLAETGHQDQDAHKLLKAAMLMRMSGARPAEKDIVDLATIWQKDVNSINPDAILQPPPPTRGRITGPAYRYGALVSEGTTVIHEIFYATRPAEVLLRLAQGSVFDIMIMSDEGEEKTVCHHKNIKKFVGCKWFPAWTGPYRIVIKNTGSQEARYYLITN